MPLDFVVVRASTFHEFRVQKPASPQGWSWWTLAVVALASSIVIQHADNNLKSKLGLILCASIILYLYIKTNALISESIVVLPCHGIQLETQRGFARMPRRTRHFIPLTVIRDVIINEGLYGWNVRYYLAIMTEDKAGHQKICVAFENFLPHFPVLHQVYNEIHDVLDDSRMNA